VTTKSWIGNPKVVKPYARACEGLMQMLVKAVEAVRAVEVVKSLMKTCEGCAIEVTLFRCVNRGTKAAPGS